MTSGPQEIIRKPEIFRKFHWRIKLVCLYSVSIRSDSLSKTRKKLSVFKIGIAVSKIYNWDLTLVANWKIVCCYFSICCCFSLIPCYEMYMKKWFVGERGFGFGKFSWTFSKKLPYEDIFQDLKTFFFKKYRRQLILTEAGNLNNWIQSKTEVNLEQMSTARGFQLSKLCRRDK